MKSLVFIKMLLFCSLVSAFSNDFKFSNEIRWPSAVQIQTYQLFLGMMEPPSFNTFLFGKSQSIITFQILTGNTFRDDGNGDHFPDFPILVDNDSLLGTFKWEFSYTEEIKFFVDGGFSAFYGGGLDEVIQDFHFLFDFPNQGREFRPAHRYGFLVGPPSARLVDSTEPVFSLTHLTMGVRGEILPGWGWALGLKPPLPVTSHIPFGAMFAASGAVYGSQRMEWHGGWGRALEWTVNLGLGYQDPGFWKEHYTMLPVIFGASLALVYEVDSFWALVAQAALVQSPFVSPSPYWGWASGSTLFGAKWWMASDLLMNLSLIEELASWSAMEVGFQWSLQYLY